MLHGNSLAGPGIIFFQVLTYTLVIGALAMIVHALGRKTERWKHPWMRYIWVLLGIVWIGAFVFALIWKDGTTLTVVAFAFVMILITEVAYLLRVVFPARAAVVEGPLCDEPAAEAPPAPSDEPIFDATFLPEPTPEEQSPDA